jgi:hypothetical protein
VTVPASPLSPTDGWSYRLGPYECFGQRYSVWTTDRALASFLGELFAPMQIDEFDRSPGDSVVYRFRPPSQNALGRLLRDDQEILTSNNGARLLWMLQWAINRQVIGNSCERHLILHAGAVECEGRTVVMPAAMEAGKTTLTTGLLDRGCSYLSDEATAVNSELGVTGYPKPLSIEPGSWDLLSHHDPRLHSGLGPLLSQQWLVPVSRFAPIANFGRLSAFVFPQYRVNAPTTCELLPPAGALSAALECVFVPHGTNMETWKVRELATVVSRVPSYRLITGDLEAACAEVLELLDGAA